MLMCEVAEMRRLVKEDRGLREVIKIRLVCKVDVMGMDMGGVVMVQDRGDIEMVRKGVLL